MRQVLMGLVVLSQTYRMKKEAFVMGTMGMA